MAGPKGSKYFDIFLNYQVWLEKRNDSGQVPDTLIALLKLIREKGSLRAAAEAAGISYRKAWGDIHAAGDFLGFPLIEAIRGGKEGGNSHLTEHGAELVAAFDALHEQFDQAIHRIIRDFFKRLNQLDPT